jgi:hypothetical protein
MIELGTCDEVAPDAKVRLKVPTSISRCGRWSHA